ARHERGARRLAVVDAAGGAVHRALLHAVAQAGAHADRARRHAEAGRAGEAVLALVVAVAGAAAGVAHVARALVVGGAVLEHAQPLVDQRVAVVVLAVALL